MENMGFSLYKKDGVLYIIKVAYEYPDARFVGFSNQETYRIYKLSDEQKKYREKNPNSEKLRNINFFGDFYYIRILPFENFPTGKPYTQLPGGGGVYKETRKCQGVQDLFKNPTIIRALNKYTTFRVQTKKKPMSEVVLTQKSPNVLFTAVLIEDEKYKKVIEKIFNYLQEEKIIPKNFKRPSLPNGDLDFHMTIKLGELPLAFKKDIDKDVSINIVSIGVSDSAVALGVSGDYFSENKNQHITLAFKYEPKDAKYIKNWKKLKKPFKIKGVIREFVQNKEIIKRGVQTTDEANQIQVGNFQANSVPLGKSRIFPMANNS
ncbi:MAG: hypothetical protein WC466_03885 [Candidatus Izemoplasmatales bacterium]